MNRKNLNTIIAIYLEQFDKLNDLFGNDESYKWRAQNTFDQYWDIDAKNFSEMFQLAMKDTKNLIDHNTVQPLGGIKALLKHDEEFVRESFRMLFTDDGGDLQKRQDRIDQFMHQINSKIEQYYKGSWKYPQTRSSLIYYLNLWRPNENYIYKFEEATKWADCIEFGDDFGSGASFSLYKYYKMCDELKAEISKNIALLQRHEEWGLRRVNKKDDDLHILVYDLIYCAKAYGFYTKMPIEKISTKERLEKAKKQLEKEKIESLLVEKGKQLDVLESEKINMPDIVGEVVSSKTYGIGRVAKIEAQDTVQYVYIYFDKGMKQFVYPNAFIQEYLILDDKNLMSKINQFVLMNKKIEALKKESDELSRQYRVL